MRNNTLDFNGRITLFCAQHNEFIRGTESWLAVVRSQENQ